MGSLVDMELCIRCKYRYNYDCECDYDYDNLYDMTIVMITDCTMYHVTKSLGSVIVLVGLPNNFVSNDPAYGSH